MTSDIELKILSPIEWKEMAENAHLAVFNEIWDKEIERIDFALVTVLKRTNTIISYLTAQKIDSDTAYAQYGGAFDSYKGTAIVYLSFHYMIEFLKSNFKRVTTLVENNNYPMLKFYMKESFQITGIRYFKNSTFLENTFEIRN